MNVFEFRNLLNSEDRKEKRKGFIRSLIKSVETGANGTQDYICLLYTSPSPRDLSTSRMPSSA